ncbi:hypothetical protein CONCODRAFT_74027 [Conidiobolus coronatus NRRL 28638]|uniref:Transmembrane protein n=1 Tax=Conidiobolus coronatus (strain ATCC 28846 / CBS 209.66 / NRRL 28638) TaxID=796925 RepID=A0A137NSZ1_CONC2|nr:hypothetical protein CONCODRAFT_74027 [Conidiobolus coronatus NRRL 28638]|eukprot:KXN65907.1 hypothetical protein CONCODRAFT_74027 [Conidiobolus coronatus NRRL 28638]
MLTNSNLIYYLVLLTQFLNFSQSLEINGDVVLCVTKLACSVPLKMNSTDYDSSFKQCTDGGTTKSKCTIEAMGFTKDQMNIYDSVVNKTVACATEEQNQYLKCTSVCSGNPKDMEDCVFDCKYKFLDIVTECFRLKSNVSESEFNEAKSCADKCSSQDMGEIFGCDVKCNGKLYKGLDIDLKNYSTVAKFAESNSESSSASMSFSSLPVVQLVSIALATIIFSLL